MATINLRSTSTLTNYVKTSTALATLAIKLAALQKLEKQQRAAVLEELDGTVRQVQVRERVYTLTPNRTESIGQVDSDESVAHCLAHGPAEIVRDRCAQWIPPASWKKAVVDGLISDESLIKRETTEIVIVT